jgi:hypothetical protein
MMLATRRERVFQDEAADLRNRIHPDVARLHFGAQSLSAAGFFDVRRGSGTAVRIMGAFSACHRRRGGCRSRCASSAMAVERCGIAPLGATHWTHLLNTTRPAK